MSEAPPDTYTVRWRRIDAPGREEAEFEKTPGGRKISGRIEVVEGGVTAELQYLVECDRGWNTRRVNVDGKAGGEAIELALLSDGAGAWTRNGIPLPHLAGALDIDLGFTPATNTLPIRRLELEVSGSAVVSAAWLRFPGLRLERLEQRYTRVSELVYRYAALVDGEVFPALLEVDPCGLVTRYEGLWEMESASRRRASPNNR